MAARKRKPSRGKAHTFGGDWTTTKLDILAAYLKSYTTALQNGSLADGCTACRIDKEPRRLDRPSDHAPVIAEFAI